MDELFKNLGQLTLSLDVYQAQYLETVEKIKEVKAAIAELAKQEEAESDL